MESGTMSNSAIETHTLYDKWALYAHLPHDTDWSMKSYKEITKLSTLECSIALYNALPDLLVKNCMLFLMKEGVTPRWEDDKNKNGGCFSFKVSNKLVSTVWKNMSYSLLGGSMCKNARYEEIINGITISPKRAFCIIKIWLSNCNYQTTSILNDIPGLEKHGCIFKRHNPEF